MANATTKYKGLEATNTSHALIGTQETRGWIYLSHTQVQYTSQEGVCVCVLLIVRLALRNNNNNNNNNNRGERETQEEEEERRKASTQRQGPQGGRATAARRTVRYAVYTTDITGIEPLMLEPTGHSKGRTVMARPGGPRYAPTNHSRLARVRLLDQS